MRFESSDDFAIQAAAARIWRTTGNAPKHAH
jgi:hypothetical protein